MQVGQEPCRIRKIDRSLHDQRLLAVGVQFILMEVQPIVPDSYRLAVEAVRGSDRPYIDSRTVHTQIAIGLRSRGRTLNGEFAIQIALHPGHIVRNEGIGHLQRQVQERDRSRNGVVRFTRLIQGCQSTDLLLVSEEVGIHLMIPGFQRQIDRIQEEFAHPFLLIEQIVDVGIGHHHEAGIGRGILQRGIQDPLHIRQIGESLGKHREVDLTQFDMDRIVSGLLFRV